MKNANCWLPFVTDSVYYCTLCGQYSLILDFPLEALPSRSSGDYVVHSAAHLKKHALYTGEMITIKREKGLEKQVRQAIMIACKRKPRDTCVFSTGSIAELVVFPWHIKASHSGPRQNTSMFCRLH